MKYIALILVLAVPVLRAAPVQTQQTITVDKIKKLEARFLLYLPADYQKKEDAQWPLMMFLHGAGERGNDLNRVKVHGPPMLAEKGKMFPFIIVSPQCPKGQVWDAEVLLALLVKMVVDSFQLYLVLH